MGASSSHDHGEKDLYTAPTEWETFDEKILEVCPGARRNVARWVPKDKPYKGVVVISHGLHEHCLRYFKVADALTKKGFVVVSLDHVGHGYSEGAKGVINDWKILPRDFSALSKSVHEEFPTLPFFILAHSMGTLVAAASMKNLPFIKAVIFSGCALAPGPAASSPFGLKALYPFSQTSAAAGMLVCMSAIAPTGSAAPLFLDEITSDEEERKLILRDGRRYPGDIMNVTANEITKMSAAVKEDVKAIRTPFMCIHGGEDKVCLPAGSEYLMNHTATPDADKSLVVVKGLRHELFHEKEPHRSEAIARVPEYFEKMCSSSQEIRM